MKKREDASPRLRLVNEEPPSGKPPWNWSGTGLNESRIKSAEGGSQNDGLRNFITDGWRRRPMFWPQVNSTGFRLSSIRKCWTLLISKSRAVNSKTSLE